MYFDDYSTSFQSLYKPMYNMSTNYSVTAGAAGDATAAGASAGYPGGWMMNPLANVGVGQFGPDQLIKNNEQKNNYYARPVAAHKKKDELPTILGIVGTALGTAALLVALGKRGKGVRVTPTPTPVPPTPTPVPPTPTPVPPTPTPVPPTPVPTPSSNTFKYNTAKVPQASKYINVDPSTLKYAPVKSVTPDVSKFGQQPYVAPKYINPNTPAYDPVKAITNPENLVKGLNNPQFGKGQGIVPFNNVEKGFERLPQYTNMPHGNYPAVVGNTVQQTTKTTGLLPQYTNMPHGNYPVTISGTPQKTGIADILQKYADDAVIVGNGSNLPAVVQKPQLKPVLEYLPNGGRTYNIPSATTKALPAHTQYALPEATVAGYLPAHNSDNVLDKVNEMQRTLSKNLNKGKVVYTTHTNETFNQAYGIGANAKGADKLAALLKQMQA